MDSLPIELLTAVLSFCDIKSLKTTRLTNKMISQISATFLYESLCITLLPVYLENLSKVAHHPTLRFLVKMIYFDGGLVCPEYRVYEEWRENIDVREPYEYYCSKCDLNPQDPGSQARYDAVARCTWAEITSNSITNFSK